MSGPRGGFTGETLLNVMRGIRDTKYKKEENIENDCATRAATKAADIAKQMTSGKATAEKLEAIEYKKNSGSCGKSHQSKDGRNFGNVWKYCQSTDIQVDFAVGFYSRVEQIGGPQERCGGTRMRSV